MLTFGQVLHYVQTSNSMCEAARKAEVHYLTFRRYAKMYSLWRPNPSGKGIAKPDRKLVGKQARYQKLLDILAGKKPHKKSGLIKSLLFEFGLKENKCEQCGIDSWMGKPIVYELDHINGDSSDHRIENIRIWCPNCHSQTATFRGRNKR